MSSRSDYGFLDRLLHRLAFASTIGQLGAAGLEERLFRKELQAIDLGPPVLITALPRAGTTILLSLLASTETFAAHTYRDVPFLFCPMLWHQLSKPFRKSATTTKERMHGDGIHISQDSPEAFEEALWKHFFKRHYGATIEPWEHCDEPEFLEFMDSHMRKIVALRARDKPTARRYVSKNNANIARIPALLESFPRATVIVPFRDPVQHAASLLRQHRRFVDLHARDNFARRYMSAIGHFDFGADLKPIDFDHWTAESQTPGPDCIGFWLDYWRATYRHILRHAGHERLHLIEFESLGGMRDLEPLARYIDIDPEQLRARQHILHSVKPREVAMDGVSAPALRDALEVHEELLRHSILGP